VAQEQLAQAKEYSRAPDNVRAAARHDLQAARHRLSSHDMFERWQYLPEHLEAIEQRIDVLDTWRDWADGKPIDRQRLVAALTTLHEHASHEPADGTQLLVTPLIAGPPSKASRFSQHDSRPSSR
jgi:hypothetical protein